MEKVSNDIRIRTPAFLGAISPSAWGFLAILLGVVCFAGTTPLSKWALESFTGLQIAGLRLALGGALALLYLTTRGKLHLLLENWKLSLLSAAGVGSFPILFSIALETLPATLTTVVLGAIPLFAGAMSVLLFREPAGRRYWIFGTIGSLTVMAYGFETVHQDQFPALALLATGVVLVSGGYTFGARLAGKLSGPLAVSCATSMLFLPGLIILGGQLPWGHLDSIIVTNKSLLGLGYVAIISQYLAFFSFYHGLARIGTARGLQVQLTQPFIGIFLVSLLVGEPLELTSIVVAAIVVGCISMSARKPREQTNGRVELSELPQALKERSPQA